MDSLYNEIFHWFLWRWMHMFGDISKRLLHFYYEGEKTCDDA